MKQYDVIVVGTGCANIVLEAAVAQGLRCAQIEKGKFGGTCLTRGCIPTKVMVTAADYVRQTEQIHRIGIEPPAPAKINWDRLSERVWEKIDESKDLKRYYQDMDGVDVYEGTGYFIDEKVMQVDLISGETSEPFTAPTIILAVGGRTKIPHIDGLEEVGYLTSESLFGYRYPQKPYKSLLIIGGGPIGTEFAHVFSAAGTEVTIIQHNVRLLPKEDEDISAQILREMRSLGVKVELNKDTLSIRREGEDKVLRYRDITTGTEYEARAEEILIAPGITCNADLLHLEKTGIATDRRGFIRANEFLETTVPGVYALGDCNGQAPFRHKANYEADIVAHNLYLKTEANDFRFAEYDLVPAVTFTYPQVGHVGMTEAQAKKAGYETAVGIHHYSETAKGFALGHRPGEADDGFVKVVAEKGSGRLLGVHIIGEEASILFQPFLNLMNAGSHPLRAINEDIASEQTAELRAAGYVRELLPGLVSTVNETMVPHPTLSEVSLWTQYFLDV
ncbi:MAG: FAD-dependent oxidoreductase [Eubacteriales bacterium]|nr:FAD-dependent oxidoreductase [Eubacteriales bacterium]